MNYIYYGINALYSYGFFFLGHKKTRVFNNRMDKCGKNTS